MVKLVFVQVLYRIPGAGETPAASPEGVARAKMHNYLEQEGIRDGSIIQIDREGSVGVFRNVHVVKDDYRGDIEVSVGYDPIGDRPLRNVHVLPESIGYNGTAAPITTHKIVRGIPRSERAELSDML